jgi:hypothetical protein
VKTQIYSDESDEKVVHKEIRVVHEEVRPTPVHSKIVRPQSPPSDTDSEDERIPGVAGSDEYY